MCCFSCCCDTSDEEGESGPKISKPNSDVTIVSQPLSSTNRNLAATSRSEPHDDPKSKAKSSPPVTSVRQILDSLYTQGSDEYRDHLEFSNLDAINERMQSPLLESQHLKSAQLLAFLQMKLESLLASQVSPDDPKLLEIQCLLAAELFRQTGQFQKSLDLSQPVLEVYKNKFGPTNPQTLGIQLLVAYTLLQAMGREREAIASFREVYDVTKEKIKSLNPNFDPLKIQKMNENALAGIAGSLKKLGDCEKAMKKYDKLYTLRLQVYGQLSGETIETQFSMAQVMKKEGKTKEALTLALKAYGDLSKCNNTKIEDDDESLLWKEHVLATLLRDQGHPLVAYKVLLEVFRKQVRIKGPLHPNTLSTLLNLGILFEREGKHELASSVYENVGVKISQVLGEHHPKAAKVKRRMAGLAGASSGWNFVMHLGVDEHGELVGHGEKVFGNE